MFERKILFTEDGSQSIYVEELNEHYHSIHGAMQESQHIFINHGLKLCNKRSLSILEIGFGTGLNALLTLLKADSNALQIDYHSLEKYPLQAEEYSQLNFGEIDGKPSDLLLHQLHECLWEQDVVISHNFTIRKSLVDLVEWQPTRNYDLVYFDAFAPDKQPQLWTEQIFSTIFHSMNDGGILSTYCAKGQVRRNMKAVGFSIEKKPGPIGKREITLALKNIKSNSL